MTRLEVNGSKTRLREKIRSIAADLNGDETNEQESLSSDVITGTQSLERAFILLREVASHGNRGARLTDLAADTGLTKATVRRLLAAMIRDKLIEQEETTRRYFLGTEVFVLGTIAAGRFSLHQLDGAELGRVAALSDAKYSGHAVPLAHLLCDRHGEAARGQTLALIYESAAGQTSYLRYGELADYSRRFAGVLQSLGVRRGDRVATFLPKGPELYIATIAIWRLGAIHVPLFATFGEPAVSYRLSHCAASAIVTNGACRSRLSKDAAAALHVITVEGDSAALAQNDLPFWSTLHAAAPIEIVETLSGDETFVLLYEAADAATPKAVPMPVKALAFIEKDMRLVLDVREEDVFWNIADPSWCGGAFYSVLGSLLLGRASLSCDGPFDASQFYRILSKLGVTNLLAPPSWYRTLRAADSFTPPWDLRLRVASSVGEVLPTDLAEWASQRLGVPIHDHYGQVEMGMPISNMHAPSLRQTLRHGSVGRTTPGFRVAILDDQGQETPPETPGELAVDVEKSPIFWFKEYYRDPARTARSFRHGRRYYLTGDLMRVDAEGNFYHLGLVEDTVAGEGYAIGGGEIEAVIAAHAAVAEAAVIDKPDKLHGEIVKAFVVLKPSREPTPALAHEIALMVKAKLAANAYPPEIEFVTTLPRTPCGKQQSAPPVRRDKATRLGSTCKSII
jgi:acetyl-CoA synthetase